MKIELPEPLASYLAAEKITDTEVLERCFAKDATVRDEGQTYKGLEAIKSWKQASQAKYQYSIEPYLHLSRLPLSETVVRVRYNSTMSVIACVACR